MLGGSALIAAVVLGALGLRTTHEIALEAGLILLVVFTAWLFFSERYELTLAVLLLYLGLADGVMKLSSGSNVATLGRDLLLYAIVLGALFRIMLRKSAVAAPPFTGIVAAWVAICLVQLANPGNSSFAHAAAALRQHLEFVPLFFLGYLVLRSDRRMTSLLVLLVIIGAANGAVTLIQSHLTPAQLASWGPGYHGLEFGTANRVARVFTSASGQVEVRPPGLGGTDGFGGLVCVIALPAALALLSSARRSVRFGWLLIPATILIIAGIVTSQARLDVVGAVIALLAFLALTLTSRRGLTALLLTGLVAVAGWFIATGFISTSPNRYSSLAPSKVFTTLTTGHHAGTLGTVPTYFVRYPLGAGLGSVGPAAGSTILGNPSATTKGKLNGESQLTFLLVETGIPGLLIILAFMVATIRAGLMLRRVADRELQRSLMAVTAVLITLCGASILATMTADSPSSPFIWLAGGCLAYWYGEMRSGRVPLRPRRIRASLAQR